jgi:hypothetical protein
MGNSIQPAIAPSNKVGKKNKTCKKFLKLNLSEIPKSIFVSQQHWSCETKHHQNDNIAFTQCFA